MDMVTLRLTWLDVLCRRLVDEPMAGSRELPPNVAIIWPVIIRTKFGCPAPKSTL